MIIWLASYPRSGNTLLRTILWQTMGLKSYSDENGEIPRKILTEKSLKVTGKIILDHDWNDFYQNASDSNDLYLVKTHQPPRDNQPAIYIVRDGRKSYSSYCQFHKITTQPPYLSLLELILGLDFYGGWSEHYLAWQERKNTLLVRYEDLVCASDSLLITLAKHINYSGQINPWQNPFDQLHQENPEFFREGEAKWQETPDWTPWIKAIFFQLHGSLMIKLGYADHEMVSNIKSKIPEEAYSLIDITQKLISERNILNRINDERQFVIDNLKKTCDERLDLINFFHQKLEK